MGGCGIVIKKRGSPVIMLLMVEYSQGENVTLELWAAAAKMANGLIRIFAFIK